MKTKNYSIIIVSDARATNKEFDLSAKLIRNSIIACAVLLIIFGYIIFDYLTVSFDKEKMKRLENENVNKEKTIYELNNNIKSLEKSLRKMAVYKEKIMVAAGLKSPNALKEVGSGGPYSMSSDIQSPQAVLNYTSPPEQNPVIKEVKQINKEAKKIENSFKFIESIIDKQKLRLASTPSIWPTSGYLTDPFGWRMHPFTGKRSFHNGQDIATQTGNKVIATADGIVLVSEHRTYYGNLMIIDHNFNFQTRYGHMASFTVKEGDKIKRGQVIGFVGNTGRSKAPHLHYEVRVFGKPQDPMKFIID